MDREARYKGLGTAPVAELSARFDLSHSTGWGARTAVASPRGDRSPYPGYLCGSSRHGDTIIGLMGRAYQRWALAPATS